jgi:hypothetical protein
MSAMLRIAKMPHRVRDTSESEIRVPSERLWADRVFFFVPRWCGEEDIA